MTSNCTLLRSVLLFSVLLWGAWFNAQAQTCNYGTFGGTLTAGCAPGTSNANVSPGTFYDVSVVNGQSYTFSVAAGNVNALCLTNTGNGALSSGGTSISWAASFTGTARLHIQPSVAWNWGSATITASIAAPANPPNPTASANPACGSFTLNAMGGQPTNVTYFWQGTSCGTDATNNAASASPTYSASGTYFVRARNASGCWSAGCGSVAVTVNTPSSGSSGITLASGTQNQCNATPTAITLNANVTTVGTSGTIQWYNGTGCIGSSAGTGTSISPTPTANTTTSWSVRVTGACNSPTTCRDFSATHSTSSSGPSGITSSAGTDICAASPSTSLTANGVSLGNGGVLRWYDGATCSGTLLNSGSNPFNPTLAANTTNTYSARVEGACNGNTTCQSISVVTRTPSTALTSVTSTNGTDICSATPTTTLNANGGSAGANPVGNIRWYNTSDCSGGIAFTGGSYTPTLTAGSTQSFSARYQDACNGNTTCQAITINSRTPSSGPTSITSSAGTTICSASPATTLTANGTVVGANPAGTINWYNGTGCSGGVQATGTTWAPTLPLSGTISYSANITGACNGATTCQSVTLTISEPAVAPSSVTSTAGFDICDANPFTDLEAIGYSLGNPAGEVYWYSGHGCIGAIEEFGPFFSPFLTPGTANLYSVHVGDACNNPTACVNVTIQARTPAEDLTGISSSNGINICSAVPATTLTANGGSLGANPAGVITWYNGLTCSGGAQATGTTWSPTLPGSGTVSFSANIVGACSGGTTCESITITTNTASSGSSGITVSSGSTTQCSNVPSSITFEANVATLGSGGTIEWYNGSGCVGTVAGTGASLVATPNPETNTSWSVRVIDACNSPTACQSISASHAVPGDGPANITSSAGTDLCDPAPTTSLSANGVTLGTTGVLRWYEGATCSGTLLNTGSNPYSPTLAANTSNVYSARVEGACNGNTPCQSITVVTRTPATDITSISSSNGTSICSATPTTTLTANGGSLGANPTGTINWYNGASCGGAPLASGTTYVPTLSASSTESFSVRIDGACSGGTTCQSISITTSTPSIAPTGITQTGGPASPECSSTPSTITLDVVGGTLGDGGSFTWYAGSCGGSAVGTGASISTNPIAGTTTDYFVRIEGACNGNTACAGPFSYTHNISSQAPTSATVDVNNFCSNAGGTIELTASGGVIGTGATAEWYTGGCGATPVGTGAIISIAKPTTTTTYHVSYVGGCNGATSCQSVTVTVLPEPTASAGATISTCTGTSDIFMAGSSAGGTFSAVNWTGGGGLGTWTSGTADPTTWYFTPSVASGSFTATLTVTGSAGCTGTNPTSTRLVQWGTTPAAPASITGPSTICNGGGTLNLSGDPVAGANDYQWSLPPGATIVSGSGTNNIGVDVSSVAAGTYVVTVVARQVDAIICTSAPSPDFNLTITSIPGIQTFLGGVSGDWNNLNNWSGGCVPGCGGSALIDPTQYANAPVISGVSAVRDIAFSNSGSITVQPTAQFSICGNVTGSGSLAVSGGGWIGFVGAANQNIAASFVSGGAGALSDVTISGGKTVTLDPLVTGLEVRDLTVTGGATLDVNGKRLFVQRNLNIATGATLNSGPDGIVEFMSAQAGTFDNQGTFEVENIEINKSGGAEVALNSMLRTTVKLTLVNGFVDATNAPLRVDNDDPAAIVGGTNTSHVLGDLERAVNTVNGGTYSWPVGDGSLLFPAQLDYVYTGEVTDYPYVSVAFVTGTPGGTIAPAVQTGRECGAQAGFVNVSGPGQWDVKGAGAGTSAGKYDLHLTLPSGTYTPCTNCSYTLLTRADLNPGTPWQLSGEPNCLADNSTPNNLVRLAMTTFSGKAVGSTADNDPFPIELIALTATPEANSIRLNWATGSERNNRGFEVQRSENMVNYDVRGFVIGAGNSSKQQSYLFADRDVVPNKRYFYRLRQVDFDGTYSFSPTVEAVITGEGGVEAALYPNPTSGNVGLSLNLQEGGTAEVRILNNLGQVVYQQQLEMTAGQNYHLLNTQNLTAGTYQVQVQIAGEMVTQRLVKFNN